MTGTLVSLALCLVNPIRSNLLIHAVELVAEEMKEEFRYHIQGSGKGVVIGQRSDYAYARFAVGPTLENLVIAPGASCTELAVTSFDWAGGTTYAETSPRDALAAISKYAEALIAQLGGGTIGPVDIIAAPEAEPPPQHVNVWPQYVTVCRICYLIVDDREAAPHCPIHGANPKSIKMAVVPEPA